MIWSLFITNWKFLRKLWSCDASQEAGVWSHKDSEMWTWSFLTVMFVCLVSDSVGHDGELTFAFCSRLLTNEELRNSLSLWFSSCSRATSSSLCSKVSWSCKETWMPTSNTHRVDWGFRSHDSLTVWGTEEPGSEFLLLLWNPEKKLTEPEIYEWRVRTIIPVCFSGGEVRVAPPTSDQQVESCSKHTEPLTDTHTNTHRVPLLLICNQITWCLEWKHRSVYITDKLVSVFSEYKL